MESENVQVESVETNTIYMMAEAMDIIIRDLARRMQSRGGEFKREKKALFSRYTSAIKSCCVISEQLNDDVVATSGKHSYKDYELWQEESNELARLMLLYADKSLEGEEAVEAIFGHLKSFRGAGIITDKVLERFYLK